MDCGSDGGDVTFSEVAVVVVVAGAVTTMLGRELRPPKGILRERERERERERDERDSRARVLVLVYARHRDKEEKTA